MFAKVSMSKLRSLISESHTHSWSGPTHREVEVVRLLLLPAHGVVPQLVRALGHALPALAVVHDLRVVADLRVHVEHEGRRAGQRAQTSPDKGGNSYISIDI